MSPEQLVFNLPVRSAQGRDDFFVSQSNELALRQIEAWENWPGAKLVLFGPQGAGKSHLVAVWAQMADACVVTPETLDKRTTGHVAVEDADTIAGHPQREEALFHLHNRVLGEGHALLITGREPPELWPVKLPDLRSRLSSAGTARLQPPDDALLSALLIKLFDDRQLNVAPEVITFLGTRIDRSYAEAEAVVSKLDQASMAARKPISVRFASSVLKQS